ncbi:alpha/beta hydrolase [Bifidobacterium sp.]|jgi:pimeloyl-ACP methyl ester carboxylesterase|uniref:PGAP1-like alpha/beta domain-containing protein n=1 Tax=Bifidobacterium sp. TaxID=41200 RepID=UPI0025C6209A|nr:alpha/beta hydrolase [Bifidobacterium sp.]MCH4208674.1 alpha/beta hydrolase [Bifidobacterium sp.]MCI1224354.1 alpha/beta hydrolase [Bifidobacterium sp.]
MSRQVSSSITGGYGYNAATREQYAAVARMLSMQAQNLLALASSWSATALQLRSRRYGTICPALSGISPAAGSDHVTLPYGRLERGCYDQAARCRSLGQELSVLASLLVRAHSLYSQAESTTRSLITKMVSAGAALSPGYAAAGFGVLAAGGAVSSSLESGRFNLVGALTSTALIQEGMLSVLSRYVNAAGLRPGGGVDRSAGILAQASSRINDAVQGKLLLVNAVHAQTPVVRETHDVAGALANLRALGAQRIGAGSSSGLDYGTIAIQRYRDAKGNASWLVTIPGTDGKADSPFGWPQNLEVMSDDPRQRMNADGARLVAQAMEQAGIGATEPVALIGHSQGGIVAASIAADMKNRYRIEHVVTAGSPIANHPVPNSTWVTSIEMEDELVRALDGAANPVRDNWLTISGHVQGAEAGPPRITPDGSCSPSGSPDANPFTAAEVEDAGGNSEISHHMQYHQAAYRNAADLGSPALQRHDEHFRHIVSGRLEETSYWQGRVYSGPAMAPLEHDGIRSLGPRKP